MNLQPQSIRLSDEESLQSLFGVGEQFIRDMEKDGKITLYRPSRKVTLVRCDDLLEALCPKAS